MGNKAENFCSRKYKSIKSDLDIHIRAKEKSYISQESLLMRFSGSERISQLHTSLQRPMCVARKYTHILFCGIVSIGSVLLRNNPLASKPKNNLQKLISLPFVIMYKSVN